jgi:hypothetical protein
MFSVHPGGKIPGVFGVEGVADDDFPSSVHTTLLEMVALCDMVIVMAGPAGLLGTIRQLTLSGKKASVESFQNDLLMQRRLGRNGRGEEAKEYP